MRIKNILVHLDPSPAGQARLAAATALAVRHQAHLTGLFLVAPPHVLLPARVLQQLAVLKEEFAKCTAAAGIRATWYGADWPGAGPDPVAAIGQFASFADLIIAGQPPPAGTVLPELTHLPERLVLGSGRPVLFLPYAGTFDRIGERVLVAWQSGPRATRALGDALPFLEAANRVVVVSVRTPGPLEQELALLGRYLHFHGVEARFDQIPRGDLGVGDLLLNMCVDEGSDLLVVGAQAVQRRGQLSFGPVGKLLMQQMTVPVLMSH